MIPKGSIIKTKMHRRRETFSRTRAIHSSKDSLRPKPRETRSRTSAAVLSNQDIWHEIRKGNISIYPFRTRNLDPSSYCVTMGEHHFFATNDGEYLNPWNKRRVFKHWEGPYKAVTINQEMFEKCGIPIGKKAIVVPGGATILTHTQEFIGGLNFIASELKGRMDLNYAGLTVCGDCGWRDIGNINRCVLFIQNTSKSPAVIPVGAPVAQIIFHYTGLPKLYLKGETQSAENLHELTKSWSPNDMLPKIPTRQFSIDKIDKRSNRKRSSHEDRSFSKPSSSPYESEEYESSTEDGEDEDKDKDNSDGDEDEDGDEDDSDDDDEDSEGEGDDKEDVSLD